MNSAVKAPNRQKSRRDQIRALFSADFVKLIAKMIHLSVGIMPTVLRVALPCRIAS